jgi:hypothetical protein
MDEVPGTSAALGTSTQVVTAEGNYGTVLWSVSQELYSLLPRNVRNDALDIACTDKVDPFFEQVVLNTLRHVGCTSDPRRLSHAASLEERSHSCPCVGELVWQISDGLLSAIPEDQREMLLNVQMGLIVAFFHTEVCRPLIDFGIRKLNGR